MRQIYSRGRTIYYFFHFIVQVLLVIGVGAKCRRCFLTFFPWVYVNNSENVFSMLESGSSSSKMENMCWDLKPLHSAVLQSG
jgi:hypothetical protein